MILFPILADKNIGMHDTFLVACINKQDRCDIEFHITSSDNNIKRTGFLDEDSQPANCAGYFDGKEYHWYYYGISQKKLIIEYQKEGGPVFWSDSNHLKLWTENNHDYEKTHFKAGEMSVTKYIKNDNMLFVIKIGPPIIYKRPVLRICSNCYKKKRMFRLCCLLK